MRITRSLSARLGRCAVSVIVAAAAATAGVAQAPSVSASPSSARAAGPVVAVSAGDSFGCALTSAGGVRCWGGNWFGRLGNGSTTDTSTPVDVAGLTSGVTSVVTDYLHACAVTSSGGLKCWGWNRYGQLGDGTTTDRTVPVDVIGLGSPVRSVAVGQSSTCALMTAGWVKCWGHNGRGALGNGSTVDSARPVAVNGLADVVSISAGEDHVCALNRAGSLRCWGSNERGELGDGTFTGLYRSTPTLVPGLKGRVASFSAGLASTCAATTTGDRSLLCWGSNAYGGLGVGDARSRTSPTPVVGLTGVTSVSVGETTTCAVKDGRAWCWGGNRFWGTVGDGTDVDQWTPVPVVGLPGVPAQVDVGSTQACAVTTAGRAFCWGGNDVGQLGIGLTSSPMHGPQRVVGLHYGVSDLTPS